MCVSRSRWEGWESIEGWARLLRYTQLRYHSRMDGRCRHTRSLTHGMAEQNREKEAPMSACHVVGRIFGAKSIGTGHFHTIRTATTTTSTGKPVGEEAAALTPVCCTWWVCVDIHGQQRADVLPRRPARRQLQRIWRGRLAHNRQAPGEDGSGS